MSRPVALVLGKSPLCPVERLRVHNLGHAALDGDAAVVVLADVGPILEHLVHDLDAEQRPVRRPKPLRVEVVADGLHRLAVGVAREHRPHERGVASSTT